MRPHFQRSLPLSARKALAAILLAQGVAMTGCSETKRPDGSVGPLPVGAKAPPLSGTDASGTTVSLVDRAGHPSVVYFYPKDDTPGCTKEACAFRDASNDFQTRGITIFGVSRDDQKSHDQFRGKYHLPFVLVADGDGHVQEQWGVPSRLGMAKRMTFLVDSSGKVARIWPDVDPAIHATEVLQAAAAAEARP